MSELVTHIIVDQGATDFWSRLLHSSPQPLAEPSCNRLVYAFTGGCAYRAPRLCARMLGANVDAPPDLRRGPAPRPGEFCGDFGVGVGPEGKARLEMLTQSAPYAKHFLSDLDNVFLGVTD